jgi:hypothetical protein
VADVVAAVKACTCNKHSKKRLTRSPSSGACHRHVHVQLTTSVCACFLRVCCFVL